MIELLIIAIALSMDAFAVSIALGSKNNSRNKPEENKFGNPFISILSLALMSGIYFGVFQGLMPVVGYYIGQGVMLWMEQWFGWIAFVLLMVVAIKMMLESFESEADKPIQQYTHKLMLVLAIATSIDAMAAGFSLMLLNVSLIIACVIIGVTTFVFSFAGVYLGKKTGLWLENKATLFGSIVLMLVAFKILLY
ncbi:MAG: manganese efflux pump MntP family protein [Gammaproteobacteria bacterium]|nr:manganese efflux pump MntP family protein [Gammaproteobacteria bacterium]MDH5629737.1 manganese efflux pump MntP family protein [Gammaproteobacteria bacterium]